jgi:hypothetical protein
MRIAVDQRGKIVDAADVFIAIDVPYTTASAARGIDRVRLHENGGAGVPTSQTRNSTIIHLLRLRIWIHSCFADPARND